MILLLAGGVGLGGSETTALLWKSQNSVSSTWAGQNSSSDTWAGQSAVSTTWKQQNEAPEE